MYTPFLSPSLLKFLEILEEPFKNSIILFLIIEVDQRDRKYFMKMFYVLRSVDLNETIRNCPSNLAQIKGTLPFVAWTLKNSCISLKKGAQENLCFAHDLHSANRNVLPGRFPPYKTSSPTKKQNQRTLQTEHHCLL